MNKLAEDLKFQSELSLEMVKYHQTRFILLDSLLKESSYNFHESSQCILLSLSKELMQWFDALHDNVRTYSSSRLDQAIQDKLLVWLGSILSNMTGRVLSNFPEADSEILSVCSEILARHRPITLSGVQEKLKYPAAVAFRDLTNFLVQFTNHAKRIVHEVDYICVNKGAVDFDPFISIDIVDLSLYQDSRMSTPMLRLKAYTDRGLVKSGSDICVKSYVDATELDSNKLLSDSFEHLLESIKENSYNIMCIL